MQKLNEIIKIKSEIVGGNAELGRLLGDISGQAIGQYINDPDKSPSIYFAIKWKKAFNENIIDMMTETVISNSNTDQRDEIIRLYKEIVRLRDEVEKYKKENSESKKTNETLREQIRSLKEIEESQAEQIRTAIESNNTMQQKLKEMAELKQKKI